MVLSVMPHICMPPLPSLLADRLTISAALGCNAAVSIQQQSSKKQVATQPFSWVYPVSRPTHASTFTASFLIHCLPPDCLSCPTDRRKGLLSVSCQP